MVICKYQKKLFSTIDMFLTIKNYNFKVVIFLHMVIELQALSVKVNLYDWGKGWGGACFSFCYGCQLRLLYSVLVMDLQYHREILFLFLLIFKILQCFFIFSILFNSMSLYIVSNVVIFFIFSVAVCYNTQQKIVKARLYYFLISLLSTSSLINFINSCCETVVVSF